MENKKARNVRSGSYPLKNLKFLYDFAAEMNLTVGDLAARMGLSRQSVYYWFKKDDVKLDLQNGYLTITANRSADHDEKDNDGHYIRQERYTGSCARSFYVGEELKPEDVKASFEDGILKLNLPKAEAKKLPEKQPTQIEIL